MSFTERRKNSLTLVAPRVIALMVCSATLGVSFAHAAATEERSDRVVDQAAVDMQDEADRDLAVLVKRYKGTKQEAEMLLRLAELRLEIAGGLFRVAYGPGENGLKKAYRAKLSGGIEPLSRIISAYPQSEAFARALFLRGKAERELGVSSPALKDLEAFVAAYPKREEAPIAAMSIADLSIEKKNFSRAVSVLARLAATPSHSLYPNALSKRAWALQADGKHEAAAAELARLASALKSRENAKNLSAADQALRDAEEPDQIGRAHV